MTKEVMVSIRGLQFDQEMDSEEIETIQWGQYYKKNDTHYIIYDELMEGCDEPTRNIIKFKEHEMNLTKRGTVNVYMVFEENKKNMTSYLTPYGSILIGLDTSRVTFTEEEKEWMDKQYGVTGVTHPVVPDWQEGTPVLSFQEGRG